MRKATSVETEVAVIGSGAAGQACAWNLARNGIRTAIVGRGTSATEMSSGCLRFGSDPCLGDERSWGEACSLSRTLVTDELMKVGLKMEEGQTTGTEMISAEGSFVVEDIVQSVIFSGRSEAIEGVRLGAIGPVSRNTFDVQLFRKVLSSRGVVVEPIVVDDTNLASGHIDHLVDAAISSGADLLFIPPFLRLDELDIKIMELERRSGRRFAEPLTPLSEAGKRLSSALQIVTSRIGVRYLDRSHVDSITIEDDGLRLMLSTGHTFIELRCKGLVFCGGGIVGGGLDIKGRKVVDPLGLMDVTIPSQIESVLDTALASGIRTGRDGSVYIRGEKALNIFAAGACLPGCNIVTGAGMGSAMASAIIASQMVIEVVR